MVVVVVVFISCMFVVDDVVNGTLWKLVCCIDSLRNTTFFSLTLCFWLVMSDWGVGLGRSYKLLRV